MIFIGNQTSRHTIQNIGNMPTLYGRVSFQHDIYCVIVTPKSYDLLANYIHDTMQSLTMSADFFRDLLISLSCMVNSQSIVLDTYAIRMLLAPNVRGAQPLYMRRRRDKL